MTTLPLWAWFAGDAVLGIVMAYGIMRNRARTRGERIATNEATKELYSASCEAVSSDEGWSFRRSPGARMRTGHSAETAV